MMVLSFGGWFDVAPGCFGGVLAFCPFRSCHVFCCSGISLRLTVYAVFRHDEDTGVCALHTACNPSFVTRFALEERMEWEIGRFHVSLRIVNLRARHLHLSVGDDEDD